LSSRDEVVLITSAQSSDRPDDGSNEDREQVDYGDDNEQVVDEQVVEEQVADEQVAEEQVADAQVAEEQVANEQVAEMQAGKQAPQGPNVSPKHARFAGDNTRKASSAGAGSAGNSDASSKEERPRSPPGLTLRRRKKKSVQEQREEATRNARIDRGCVSSSLEALTSALSHTFQALPTGKPTHKQAVQAAGRGDAGDHVPLSGPFVAQEEAANLAAAREAQKAENAASEKAKRAMRDARSASVPTVSSSEKPKASKKPAKGSALKKTTPSKREKSQTPQKETTQPPSLRDTHEQRLACDAKQDGHIEQSATAAAEPAPAGHLPVTVASSSSSTGPRTVVPIPASGPSIAQFRSAHRFSSG
jgi:hypothetical protein